MKTNNVDRAEELKSIYSAKYKNLTNDELYVALGDWITQENQKNGYLPGLSPRENITHLTQMMEMCAKCDNPEGHCDISNMLRNMASTELLLKFMGNKLGEAQELIEKSYENYVMLQEHTSRVCAGTWYQNLYIKPITCSVEQKGLV